MISDKDLNMLKESRWWVITAECTLLLVIGLVYELVYLLTME